MVLFWTQFLFRWFSYLFLLFPCTEIITKIVYCCASIMWLLRASPDDDQVWEVVEVANGCTVWRFWLRHTELQIPRPEKRQDVRERWPLRAPGRGVGWQQPAGKCQRMHSHAYLVRSCFLQETEEGVSTSQAFLYLLVSEEEEEVRTMPKLFSFILYSF